MFRLLERMRTGQLSSGTLKPYSWLDLATQPKPEQQIKIERFFESCSFKSVISYVMGEDFWLNMERTTPKFSHATVTGFRSPVSSVVENFRGIVLQY